MADPVLLNGVKRFWSEDQVRTTYEAILTAYHQRQTDQVTIIGKTGESDSATGQVVIHREDFRDWMDVLEARLVELEAEAAGNQPLASDSPHLNFSGRYVRT